MLSTRCIIEMDTYIRTMYQDQVKECHICRNIVFQVRSRFVSTSLSWCAFNQQTRLTDIFLSPPSISCLSVKFVTILHVALKCTTRVWQDTLKEERSRGAQPARTSGHTKSLVCAYVRMCVCIYSQPSNNIYLQHLFCNTAFIQ